MRFRSSTTAIAIGFMMAIGQLLLSLIGSAAAVLCGVAIGLISFVLYRLFERDASDLWVPIVVATGASALGITIRYGAGWEVAGWTMWLAPLAACCSAFVAVLIYGQAAKKCPLCKHRIGSGGSFDCPRCGLRVCERTCWVFDHLRCRLCEENRVPLFTQENRWWDSQFGPAAKYGKCQLCGASVNERELRACGRCARPQCRTCWDYNNGQCPRCGWIVAGLPSQLKLYIIPQPSKIKVADGNRAAN